MGSIGPASNIGTGGATPAPPAPITYLTQWKIVGNSEVHTLPYPDGVILPNGYKRCEYLTFDGSSYINTGIKTANDIGYNLACSINENKPTCLIGSRLSQNTQGFVLGFEYVAYGGVSTVKGITYNQTKTTVILDSTQCKVGGINYDITNIRHTADSFFDIYIGSWNNNNNVDARMWKGNIYDTIIYNTQGELWHGIPCLDANDVPCFYDLVSQTAFYNQGSGSFTYELYPQQTEIWSCGEYNATDGKYHILVKPLGGSIADIALDEPLRKVNNVADTLEFPSSVDGKALVTRKLAFFSETKFTVDHMDSATKLCLTYGKFVGANYSPYETGNILCNKIENGLSIADARIYNGVCFGMQFNNIWIRNGTIEQTLESYQSYFNRLGAIEVVYQLATPTTELVDAPQIEEAESYSMIISQGAKAVEWSSFETDRE